MQIFNVKWVKQIERRRMGKVSHMEESCAFSQTSVYDHWDITDLVAIERGKFCHFSTLPNHVTQNNGQLLETAHDLPTIYWQKSIIHITII